jgi:hypothetical protein
MEVKSEFAPFLPAFLRDGESATKAILLDVSASLKASYRPLPAFSARPWMLGDNAISALNRWMMGGGWWLVGGGIVYEENRLSLTLPAPGKPGR